MKLLKAIWAYWVDLFAEEDASEPRFDPIHLATVLIACQAAVAIVFWLLWTAMVYEDGYGLGEGWMGNVAAMLIIAALIEALRRADRRHARIPR